ncbi:MPN396 family protein [[Mycoplasma] testudinis]|uniref:MPN396 family protein n=1 Tax=[Mycoplasma] testudinis TaxID=33924 RepID=UPI0004830FEB|nr:hypothetical protein [[Mycoplasma] testudinis]
MFKKKPSFDLLLKSGFIFILMILSLLGIIFGALRISSVTSRGSTYDGAVSTTVFFSPYKENEQTASTQQPIQDTFASARNPNDTTLMSDQEIQAMLTNAANTYANRLFLQGFNQVTITQNLNNQQAANFTDDTDPDIASIVNSSWLINNGLPSLTITVNKNIVQGANVTDRDYDQQVLRSALFNVSRNYDLSLQTTDGHVIFDSNSPEFIANSLQAVQPPTGSTSSALTFELNIPGSTINNDPNGITSYINSKLTGITTDYNSGNGQSSVNAPGFGSNRGRVLFPPAASSTDIRGNQDIVLWNDKPAALQFVRNIFATPEGSAAYFSFSTQERALYDFLHRNGTYASNDPSHLIEGVYNTAADIHLNDLYYLYAIPKAYTVAAANTNANNNTSSADVTTPSDIRTSRGGSTDFSSLFSPYILYEGRVITNSESATINPTVQSLFPTNQQLNFGGNTKVVLSQILQGTGTYGSLNFGEATRLKSLLESGQLPQDAIIVGALPTLQNAAISSTLTTVNGIGRIDAFGSSLIALGVVLLAVGIIVSILYKVPGIFNLLSIILGSVLTVLLYDRFGGQIDLYTFIGLFISMAVGVGTLIYINEVFRRHVRNSTSLGEAARLTYKSTFMKVVDAHLITLVLGLLLMYVGRYQEQSIGVIFVVGSFTSFFIVYGLSVLLNKVFFAINNWTNYRWFVYKRDAKWLNEITGQLELKSHDHLQLNEVVNSADSDIHNLFKQKTRFDFLSKTGIGLLAFWLIALGAGIAAIVLFSENKIFSLTAITQNSATIVLMAAMITFAIGLVYFMLRYRWLISIPYLAVGLINFFGILVAPLALGTILDIRFQFEGILILLGTWTISHVMIVYGIGWNYQYWYSYAIYKKQTIHQIISNNIASMSRFSVFNYFVLPFALIVFSAFNYGGFLGTSFNLYLFVLFGFGAIGNLVGNLSSWVLLPQLLGLMMRVRQKVMIKQEIHQTGKVKKQQKSYDKVDEQIIPGINQRLSERRY